MFDTGCTLTACHICTGCYHGHHDKCRKTVRCPDTGIVNRCDCCNQGECFEMSPGFYVVVRDGSRSRVLFGPLETKEGADSYVDNARPLMTGMAHFYDVGVAHYAQRRSAR